MLFEKILFDKMLFDKMLFDTNYEGGVKQTFPIQLKVIWNLSESDNSPKNKEKIELIKLL